MQIVGGYRFAAKWAMTKTKQLLPARHPLYLATVRLGTDWVSRSWDGHGLATLALKWFLLVPGTSGPELNGPQGLISGNDDRHGSSILPYHAKGWLWDWNGIETAVSHCDFQCKRIRTDAPLAQLTAPKVLLVLMHGDWAMPINRPGMRATTINYHWESGHMLIILHGTDQIGRDPKYHGINRKMTFGEFYPGLIHNVISGGIE